MSKPTINLYHRDCMELMRETPDKYYDLAICDPPYGISVNMNAGRKKGERKRHEDKRWDDSIPSDDYFEELMRVSKNQIIWGGNYFPLPLTKSWIFWDKNIPKGMSFADGELAWTSIDIVLRKANIPYSGFVGSDISRIHPTQKPVALYKWLLHNYAKQGDKILDTHLGSGSIAIACHEMGFDLDACEIDKDYYDAAVKRFKQNTSQQKLFTS